MQNWAGSVGHWMQELLHHFQLECPAGDRAWGSLWDVPSQENARAEQHAVQQGDPTSQGRL